MEDERPWANLPADLVSLITGAREMSLVDYTSIRATCWRSTMPPATPLLIYTAAGTGQSPYNPVFFAAAFSLPAQRRLEARDRLDLVLTNGSFCVGSGYGWLAIDELVVATSQSRTRRLILMNPISGERIQLPELVKDPEWAVNKLVFAPNPSVADFTAVAIYGFDDEWRVAYARSGDKSWKELPQDREFMNTIVDLVYHDDGMVYGLTMSSAVRLICLPGGGEGEMTQTARVESLLPEGDGSLPHDPAKVFEIRRFRFLSYTHCGNNDRYLVFCEGNMYQVWRNLISIRGAELYGGLRDAELGKKEIIVLKHEPGSWPCWREVNDLGGHSVFIGKNNAVSVRVVGTPWLKPDCVYWVGGHEEERAMVFDMATQMTTPCVPNARLEGFAQWASCWYFLK